MDKINRTWQPNQTASSSFSGNGMSLFMPFLHLAAVTVIYFALFFVNSSPAHREVKGATLTSPKEPITVWIISAATYL